MTSSSQSLRSMFGIKTSLTSETNDVSRYDFELQGHGQSMLLVVACECQNRAFPSETNHRWQNTQSVPFHLFPYNSHNSKCAQHEKRMEKSINRVLCSYKDFVIVKNRTPAMIQVASKATK